MTLRTTDRLQVKPLSLSFEAIVFNILGVPVFIPLVTADEPVMRSLDQRCTKAQSASNLLQLPPLPAAEECSITRTAWNPAGVTVLEAPGGWGWLLSRRLNVKDPG